MIVHHQNLIDLLDLCAWQTTPLLQAFYPPLKHHDTHPRPGPITLISIPLSITIPKTLRGEEDVLRADFAIDDLLLMKMLESSQHALYQIRSHGL